MGHRAVDYRISKGSDDVGTVKNTVGILALSFDFSAELAIAVVR
jgi:hypothetical protein